ncbi:MAG: hypothetical protein LBQ22_12435 [Bacteroidales bacterium]|jgi:tRNA(Ile)-lysidine synthase TilS/MesJ|nr:hypothetical protein [Bacteroidales bacterium]
MKTCTKCIINDNYPGLTFNETGECSLCTSGKKFKPIGEEKLLEIFENAKNKNSGYDALVPLSGGKDSTYILHLAVNVYKLKVLAMTYDNGFLTPIALDNIKRSLEITDVDHVFCRPDPVILKKVYKNMLLFSGDICGACDIGTKANILKVSADYRTPIILYGTSPLEEDSFVPDSIQDVTRFKYILKQSGEFTKKEMKEFLIYPNFNFLYLTLNKKIGKFGKEVRPLFYLTNPSDKEVGAIIEKELGWKDDAREYSKHLDCLAEPLTNYIRNKIYGYERRICQFSNMIRKNEITREHALQMYTEDKIDSLPENCQYIFNELGITEEDLNHVIEIPPLKYEKHTSRINSIFLKFVKAKKKLSMR